jgi:hypothetical protein
VGTISRSRINARTRALFEALGLPPIAPDRAVRSLSIGEQQLVEIAKGLAPDPDILILDEATSALLPREVEWLLGIARRRADAGKLVLYISHRLGEVRRIADRVTVLRNGETVGTEATAKLSDDDIIAMMIGLIFFGVIWQMVGGWAYLLLVVRTRGKIGRSECLLLGIALMLLLPAVLSLLIFADPSPEAAEVAADFTPPWILLSFGVFLIFGLISGGLLWWVGVRPAKTPVAASASVFE